MNFLMDFIRRKDGIERIVNENMQETIFENDSQ